MRPWRRSRIEPPRSAAVPPPDGAAGCLDAYSRAWQREPLAGRFVDWSEAAHMAGFGAGFCGVWHEDEPLVPIERFPIDPAGIQAANALLRRLEVLPLVEARILSGARLVAHAGETLLLLAQEREQPGWHVHAGVSESAWFAHAFRDALPELPHTQPGSATLADARERLAEEWGELEWDAVPPTVPRGLLDTAPLGALTAARSRVVDSDEAPRRAAPRGRLACSHTCHCAPSSATSRTIQMLPSSPSRAHRRSSRCRCAPS